MNSESWKLILSIGGVLLTTVTMPLLLYMRAAIGKAAAELKLEIANVGSELKLEIAAAEKRLNERIDTRLIHR